VSEKEYIENYLNKILDGTIVQVGAHREKEEPELGYWPMFWVRDKNEDFWQVVVSCDPEENGPGHLSIDEAEST